MAVRVEGYDRGDIAVLAPVGEIDLQNAPQVRERLTHLRSQGRRVVVIDLSGVEFLDSSALGMFVGAQQDFGADGGGLRIACPPPHAQKVFRITRLAEVIPIYESVDAASTVD
jgi:anti-sigma B factor antagonist